MAAIVQGLFWASPRAIAQRQEQKGGFLRFVACCGEQGWIFTNAPLTPLRDWQGFYLQTTCCPLCFYDEKLLSLQIDV